jgi:hypothetical protein
VLGSVVKKRPQTDIHAVSLELRRIRDQHRRYDRTRGVSKKMHEFALTDVIRMADALLPPTATACSRGGTIFRPPSAPAPEIEGVPGKHEQPMTGPGLDSHEEYAQPYESNSNELLPTVLQKDRRGKIHKPLLCSRLC